MMMSATTSKGGDWSTAVSASRPLLAVSTVYSSERSLLRDLHSETSSSTTRIRGFGEPDVRLSASCMRLRPSSVRKAAGGAAL